MHGSGALIRWLFDNRLVDEIILLTYPVAVGQGTRLFPHSGPDAALDLIDSRSTPGGVTIQVYRLTGSLIAPAGRCSPQSPAAVRPPRPREPWRSSSPSGRSSNGSTVRPRRGRSPSSSPLGACSSP
ncbi:dihydrofolate reductase family protein [Streptomyces sp. NPDC006307]|uniref:dihydrofolate reductase family protein n=1 Tax=Streptomyces sp. NPDC006307 TaxID=3156748 RepID=UPI0033A08EFA